MPLSGDDPAPERHQVTELPEVKPLVIECQCHTLRCHGCGAATKGAFPRGVSYRSFGARLTAFIAWLTGKFHLSHRDVTELLCEGFGIQMATGSVSNCQDQVSMALSAPVKQVAKQVEASRCVHADETGFRLHKERGWLWVAVADECTLFLLHDSRGACAAKHLLGEFDGYLVTDSVARLQRTSPGQVPGVLGPSGAAVRRHGGGQRPDGCGGQGSGGADRAIVRPAQAAARGGAEPQSVRGADGAAAAGCGRTAATRCAAFRAIVGPLRRDPQTPRGAVDVRVRGGSGADEQPSGAGGAASGTVAEGELRRAKRGGAQFVERILTVLTTCKRQGRNALSYLEKVVATVARGEKAPLLLPEAVAQPP
ncbi:MAG: transposase [Myxococcales bacterium]|nr:transposase [Myxococcales bacterium]